MFHKIRNFFRMNFSLKFGSLARFYQLKYFAGNDDKIFVMKMKNGLNFTVNKKAGDLTTLYEIFIDEDYKYDNNNNKNLKFLDIGANVGYFSLYISQKFPFSSVFSFEPFPSTFSRLKENLKLNNINNVEIYPFAVSNTKSTAEFYSVDWAGCNTLLKGRFDEGQYKTTLVETISFDEIPALTGTERFDFAKIDCEGSEYTIFLKSSKDAIRCVKKYAIEVHLDKNFSSDDLINCLKEAGYSTTFLNNILVAERID